MTTAAAAVDDREQTAAVEGECVGGDRGGDRQVERDRAGRREADQLPIFSVLGLARDAALLAKGLRVDERVEFRVDDGQSGTASGYPASISIDALDDYEQQFAEAKHLLHLG